MKRMRLRRALGLVMLLIVAGALYLYAAHNAGRKELRALCEQGVEPKVYRRVEAEGYFDSGITCLNVGCWDVLLGSPFRYIETEKREADPWDVLPENGFYRFTRENIRSGLCTQKILSDLKNAASFRKFVQHGDCIRMERIDEPKAAYGLYTEPGRLITVDNFFRSKISERHAYIKSLRNDEVIAERWSYLLHQNAFRSFSSFKNVVTCRAVGVRQTIPDVVNVEFYIRNK